MSKIANMKSQILVEKLTDVKQNPSKMGLLVGQKGVINFLERLVRQYCAAQVPIPVAAVLMASLTALVYMCCTALLGKLH